MCAIIGADNLSQLEILYGVNCERGMYASSLVCLQENNQIVHKQEGEIKFGDHKLDDSYDYFLSHMQAPTSSMRTWSYDTSHPFESLSWMVMHNGVLTNWKELNELYTPWNVNPVDTAVIACMLQQFTEDAADNNELKEPIHIVKQVLELLEGTFALCIVDTDNNTVYLARQGSILHYHLNGSFSTIPGKDYKLISEGDILTLTDFNTWTVAEKFKTNSPFLFL